MYSRLLYLLDHCPLVDVMAYFDRLSHSSLPMGAIMALAWQVGDGAALSAKPAAGLTQIISAVDPDTQTLITELFLSYPSSTVWAAQPSYIKHCKHACQSSVHQAPLSSWCSAHSSYDLTHQSIDDSTCWSCVEVLHHSSDYAFSVL